MKLRDLDLSDHPVNAEHQALGLPPVETHVTAATQRTAIVDQRVLRVALWSVVFKGHPLRSARPPSRHLDPAARPACAWPWAAVRPAASPTSG